ncbi:GIY-YIG nuclease family protein [Patescibacteria group bacterium]|nr:MAG: GIY-YIG nuclease family protein [Patescibacteria group bacterium]
MAHDRQYAVYILTNVTNHVLYTGVTNNLARRVYEHHQKFVKGFTAKYNVTKLVYFEAFSGAYEAITREKQIKGWVRRKKIALIDSVNPIWADVSGNLH